MNPVQLISEFVDELCEGNLDKARMLALSMSASLLEVARDIWETERRRMGTKLSSSAPF